MLQCSSRYHFQICSTKSRHFFKRTQHYSLLIMVGMKRSTLLEGDKRDLGELDIIIFKSIEAPTIPLLWLIWGNKRVGPLLNFWLFLAVLRSWWHIRSARMCLISWPLLLTFFEIFLSGLRLMVEALQCYFLLNGDMEICFQRLVFFFVLWFSW